MKTLLSKAIISIVVGLVGLLSPTASAQQISLVSVNYAGTGAGDDWSMYFVGGHRKSAQGRYVGFISYAKNIVPNGTGPLICQLYVRDLQTGTTQLISKNYQTGGPSNGNATTFEFSKDGQYLAFLSGATDLLPGVSNTGRGLCVRDMQTGVLKIVDVTMPGPPIYTTFPRFSISDDGKKVAFASAGGNSGLPYDRNRLEDVYVYDVETGRSTLASVDRAGVRAGNGISNLLEISGNGRYVLFASAAANLVDEPVRTDVRNFYVRDLVANTTKLVSVTRSGTGGSVGGVSDYYWTEHKHWISDDGRYVTFFGVGDDYTANDNNNTADLFQRDLLTGTTALVSVGVNGMAAGVDYSDSRPDYAVTPNGRFVAFTSWSSNLVAGDDNWKNDCFVRDMATGTTRSVTGTLPRADMMSNVNWLDLSPDGRYVFFDLLEEPNGTTAIESHGILIDLETGLKSDFSAPQGTYLGEVGSGGFSPGSDLFVLSAEFRLLPIDNNNTGDIYVVRLGSAVKPRGLVALNTPLGQ